MQKRPIIEEKYSKGSEEINYVVYESSSGLGNDEVLQHKLFGSAETAHITVHPDGSVNLREKRTRTYLVLAVRNRMSGYTPAISNNVKAFLLKVENKV
jgi:hypothetical protein